MDYYRYLIIHHHDYGVSTIFFKTNLRYDQIPDNDGLADLFFIHYEPDKGETLELIEISEQSDWSILSIENNEFKVR